MEIIMSRIKEIPLFVNTLENSYLTICICGTGIVAENLYDYLKENKSIHVWQKETIEENYKFPRATELVIFMNEVLFEPINVDGDRVYFIEYERMFHTNDCMPFNDIYQNVIPKLLMDGIRILVVKTPDLRQYRPKIPLYVSLLYFNLIQRYHGNRDIVLLKHYGQKELIDEFMNTKADKSKGYLRVFGNGKYINYDDGFRRVPSREEIQNDKPHIYLFGFCISANPMLPDDKTIAANLQRFVHAKYRVCSRGNDGASINLIMRNIRYQKDDIVILFTSHHDCSPEQMGLETIDLTSVYADIPKLWKHISDGAFHCDAHIAEVISQCIWDKVKKYSISNQKTKYTVFGSDKRRAPAIQMYKDTQLIEYVNQLSRFYRGGGKRCYSNELQSIYIWA